ncbi:MAG: DUF3450 domain-containing protein [Pseudomonadota bacterium]|nr:DUF3450 domain-containing protein [Pseudomonadota bacterium]
MTHQYTLRIIRLYFFVLCLVLPASVRATDSDSAQQSLQRVEQTITIRQETQKKEDAWDSEKKRLTVRFKALQETRKALLFEQKRNRLQLNNIRERVKEAERKTIESARLRKELTAYLSTVVEKVDNLTAAGLPFLASERNQRLLEIKETLIDPEITAAEKYRRVMEALQIEAEYRHTVEVYPQEIEVAGEKKMVEVLRLGGLALFWRSPDGGSVGEYDRLKQAWDSLDKRYQTPINKAMEISLKQRTIEMVSLPIGRIKAP